MQFQRLFHWVAHEPKMPYSNRTGATKAGLRSRFRSGRNQASRPWHPNWLKKTYPSPIEWPKDPPGSLTPAHHIPVAEIPIGRNLEEVKRSWLSNSDFYIACAPNKLPIKPPVCLDHTRFGFGQDFDLR